MQAILDGMNVMSEGIFGMHVGWIIWVNWLMVVNTAAILFALKHPPALVIFVTFMANGVFMMWMAGTFGYVRLLGLSHIIFWTPLLIYLYVKYRAEDFDRKSLFGRYLLVLMLTNAASLIIDWVDVIRYALGERGTA